SVIVRDHTPQVIRVVERVPSAPMAPLCHQAMAGDGQVQQRWSESGLPEQPMLVAPETPWLPGDPSPQVIVGDQLPQVVEVDRARQTAPADSLPPEQAALGTINELERLFDQLQPGVIECWETRSDETSTMLVQAMADDLRGADGCMMRDLTP